MTTKKRSVRTTTSRASASANRAPSRAPRRLPEQPRRWFRPSTWHAARSRPLYTPLPGGRYLLVQSWRIMQPHASSFAGAAAVYAVAMALLVGGMVASTELEGVKNALSQHMPGGESRAKTALFQLVYMLGGNGAGTSATSGVYQTIVLTVCTLALIYMLRERYAGRAVTTKQAFYNGMQPLIPFAAVTLVLLLQLSVFGLGTLLYNLGVSGMITTAVWEKVVAAAVSVGLMAWAVHMAIASFFALYIVTLPGMTPLRALKGGRDIVYKRRLQLLRKILYFVVVASVGLVVVLFPVLLLVTPLAPWVFLLSGAVLFVLAHGYMYALYRELL